MHFAKNPGLLREDAMALEQWRLVVITRNTTVSATLAAVGWAGPA